MEKSYLDYLLSEWADYHYHGQIASIGFNKHSSTYRACKALEAGAVIIPTVQYIDNTPDHIDKIDKALDELSSILSQVIVMEYLGQGRRQEKTDKLNITKGVYSARLSRARTQLINIL